MAAPKKTEPTAIPVPGVTDLSRLPRNTAVAVFVPGVEAYTTVTGPTVTLGDSSGKTLDVALLGSEAGRLFALAQRFVAQSTSSMVGLTQPMNTSFQDIALFNGLVESYGNDSIDPRAPYTVLVVQAPGTV